MKRPPHVVIFNPDQWRGDVMGHLGNSAAVTPNLDRLVRDEAVSFRWAFCQNPVCTPSRCSFMTGWYPHVRGHRTMYHMLHAERGEPCLLKLLKDNGYFVWWGGKNDLVPAQHGYSEFCDVKYSPTRPVHRDSHEVSDWRGLPGDDNYYSFYRGRLDKDAAEYYRDGDWACIEGAIEAIASHTGDKPLCLYLPLSFPHPPYCVEEPYFSAIDRAALPPRVPAPGDWDGKPSVLRGIHQRQRLQSWTESRWTELRACYYGMCMRVDDQLGRLVQALRRKGMWDDTALFMFSDHGDFTGDYGLVEKTQNTFEDCLSRVPFVIKPPRTTMCRAGVRDALVELIDFPATVFDLTNIDPGYTHFGRSLLPVISGERAEHRDAVFCEGGRLEEEQHCSDRASTSATNPAGLYWPRVGLQARLPEHTKATMCRTNRYKYVRRLAEQDELYDLHSDPQELQNVIDDSSYADGLASLRDRMLEWYQQTCDVVPYDGDRR